eukprot:jgi/Ulvmu1/4610/UM002_0339.1
MDLALQRREHLRQALTDATNELTSIESSLKARHNRELRSWNDEAPALEVYASAMGQTADVMRGELETLRGNMHAAMQSTGHVPGKPGTTGNLSAESEAAVSLSQEIARLVQHMETIDKQLAECRSLYSSAQHLEDKALWETQLVALQDTKKLTVGELERLRVELVLKRRAVAYLEHRDSGQAKIMQLQDELASTISKVDRVKQLLLFPAVEGYRFRAGSGRVFLGSKDLFVSELAASFHFSCHRAVGSDGRPKAALAFKIGNDPPRMSFSTYTPTAHRGPSVFTAGARPHRYPSQAGTSAPADGVSPATHTVSAAPAQAATKAAAGALPPRPIPSAAVPLHASSVPPEAPQQGVWYNGAPFGATPGSMHERGLGDRPTSDSLPTAVEDPQLPQLEDSDNEDARDAGGGEGSSRAAGGVAEGIEGDSGSLAGRGSDAGLPEEPLAPTANPHAHGGHAGPADPAAPAGQHALHAGHAAFGSHRAAARQHAHGVASAIASRGSKGKQAAVGFLNKLSQTKKFGARRHADDSPASPRSPAAPPSAPAPPAAAEPSSRSAILTKMAQAEHFAGHAGMPGRDIRSKFMHVSKKGVANMGAFVKQTSTKASAAVNQGVQGMHKLRQTHSPRQSGGTPTFEEALAQLPLVRQTSTSLPDLGHDTSLETSGSESDVLRTDSMASDGLRLGTEPSVSAPAATKPAVSEDSAEFVHVPPAAEAASAAAAATAATAEPAAAAASAPSTLLQGESQRRSSEVFLRVQASDVKVVGEKGTKVPNFMVKELALLLECRMEAAFEWTELDGWRPTHKLKLSITQLEHSISGTTVPVPKTLLKYMLNLLLPAVIEARLLAVLPAEVGQYFVGKDTPGVQVGGRLHVYGPSLTMLNADLAMDPAAAAAAAGVKAKKAATSAASATAARASLGLSLPQCTVLSDLLCSKHSCILPHQARSLSISSICHLLSPLAGHPDLLNRWKSALHGAVDALCTFRNVPAINWRDLSEKILEPAIRKPLRLRFVLTCLDLSFNVNGVISSTHSYFTRVAHAEAARSPAGSTMLAEQLAALDELHSWLVGRVHSFRRRFKAARATVLTSLDATSLKLCLEDVQYQGPLHVEVPAKTFTRSEQDCLSFDVKLPATLDRRSVLRDALRVLLGDTAADRAYWAQTILKRLRGDSGRGAAAEQEHPLLPDKEEEAGGDEGERLPVGTLEVSNFSYKLVLEDDLIQSMLGLAPDGSITGDSLARVLQLFGPCMQLSIGTAAVPRTVTGTTAAAAGAGPESEAGLLLNTGEVCNAHITASHVGCSSLIPPLRVIRLLHTVATTVSMQKDERTQPAAKMDAFFFSLARYVGSKALDMSTTLQLGLAQTDACLLLQLVGTAPATDAGQSCCVSLTNEMDMTTVLDSIDLSQGAPVDHG